MQNLLFKTAREMSARTVWRHPCEDFFEIEFSFCNGSSAISTRCRDTSKGLKSGFGSDRTMRILAGEQFEYKFDHRDYLYFSARAANSRKIDLKIEFRHNRETGCNSSGVMFFALLPEEFDAFFGTLGELTGQPGECCALRLNREYGSSHISVMHPEYADESRPGTGRMAISA